jgi:hypothetical protein
MRAFLIMLKGLAQDFYYNNWLSDHSFVNSYKKLYTFFKPLEYLRANLNKWNSITLDTIAFKHLDKPIREVVQLLVNELGELQNGLQEDLKTPSFLLNKIVIACQGTLACQYAISDPLIDLR